jgi:hypothetical protein
MYGRISTFYIGVRKSEAQWVEADIVAIKQRILEARFVSLSAQRDLTVYNISDTFSQLWL